LVSTLKILHPEMLIDGHEMAMAAGHAKYREKQGHQPKASRNSMSTWTGDQPLAIADKPLGISAAPVTRIPGRQNTPESLWELRQNDRHPEALQPYIQRANEGNLRFSLSEQQREVAQQRIEELRKLHAEHEEENKLYISSTKMSNWKMVIANHFFAGGAKTKALGWMICELMDNKEDWLLVMTLYMLADSNLVHLLAGEKVPGHATNRQIKDMST
jgi:hypothetical protein